MSRDRRRAAAVGILALMVKPMKYRELTALLREAGFVWRDGKGDHEVWSKGAERVSITQAREVSPGLVRKALAAIERSEG